ncbi:hypothetical protein SPRG_06494 [Saprolegnia parasitica CBS 223.65]|uniref:peptidylprolyl isomerase n=1 Tax=Saprolegnia parasitica (strain CBS 223.65) TaxID=695850 RepID=A0A067CHH9_SAPPC|nr:hypothetical protein SPRG_06494 [Saprolegnia parasitica CBS 223.65]KDO28640.1 hypothetical protein SPRG_06494 [Saprolegnia parasitica CBS 223.65]|eukprot:XP_012200701.1 hypothetical protein SPRG_06494 [Saprolegnia parasitica CBS 223.65]
MDAAATKLQCMYRARLARRAACAKLQTVVQRYYDADSGMYYYYNASTQASTWVKPKLLGSDDAPLGAVSQDLATTIDEPTAHVGDAIDAAPTENNRAEDGPPPGHELVADRPPTESETHGDASEVVRTTEKAATSTDDERRKSQHLNASAANPYSADELRMIEEQFRKFDTDGSGEISLDELQAMLHSFGDMVTKDDIQTLVDTVGIASTHINLSQFMAILHHQREHDAYCPSIELALMFGPDEIANLRAQFQAIDADASGEIDESELATLMKNLGQNPRAMDLKAIIHEVDRDGNGTINFNECVEFAALLALGVAKGLLTDLGDVLAATKNKVSMWNANRLAEERRLRARRERELELERQRREAEAREQQMYQDELDRLDALARERLTMVPGLRHEVLLEGHAFLHDKENYPNRGQYARVHYVGAFENGKVFESSRTRGGALEFKVGCGHVIEGWDVALLRMSVGETARITCAPKLAYGVKGRPPKIPGNATLVFTIELIAIKEKVVRSGDDDGSDDDS